jgi:uncharacterized protein
LQARDIPIAVLRFYQFAISPLFGNCCRFAPSCSEYMIRSISLNGILAGMVDGVRRILRCHPFHPGGVDEPRRIDIIGIMRHRWKNG